MNAEHLHEILANYKTISKYSDKQDISINKDDSLSVFVYGLLIFKLTKQAKQYKLSVKYNLTDYSAADNKEGLVTYFIENGNEHELEEYVQLILKGVDKFVYDNYAADSFGCCHRFVECSDAKVCTHPDELHAKGCMYKSNLDAGRIFYGKNKNV